MNTTIPQFESKGLLQPSGDSSPSAAALSVLRNPSAPFLWVALVAGLLFLLLSAPAVRADRNPPNCSGSGLGISLFTSLPDVHVGDTIYYSVTVFNTPFPACDAGATNSASAGAIRAYVVTPDGVTNAITLVRTFLTPGDSDYYNNVVSYVVRAVDVLADGTVRATAVDTGDIHQNDVNSRGGGNQGVNTMVNKPCVGITAKCVGGVGENGPITFTGTVTNCGNTMLIGLTVSNSSSGFVVLGPTNLDVGQTASFSGSWVPSNPCLPSTATLTVRATDENTSTPQVVISSTSVTCQNTLTPGIKVTKVCPQQPVSPGQLLTFSGSVSNTGNVTLTNIVVVNNQPSNNTPVLTLASLAPGAAANFTGSYPAPTNCSVADTLIASGRSVCGDAVIATASATCPILTRPQIAVAAVCPTAPVLPGGSLTYSGTVTNTGDITLTNVVVVSDRPAANTTVLTVATLAPGASINFTGTYPVPTNVCTITTTFSGTGQDICTLNTVTNAVSVTCPVTTAAGIAITQVCPANPAVPGGLLIYSGTVSNSGNITLTNVVVLNNVSGATPVFTAATMAPGAVANFTGSYVAPTNCFSTSTSTATGRSICGVAVANTASATCPITTTPAIAVTQLCPVTAQAIPGGLLTYSGTVSNAGNITLTNVVVLNNLSGATPIFTTTNLAPGAVASFTGSYVAPTNCSSTSTSTATGQSVCGGGVVTAAVSATCPITTSPAIAITQVCPANPAVPGGLLIYSGTVSNAGNVTLNDVEVVNNLSGATPIFIATNLAPGAVANFTGSYVAPTNCSTTSISSVTGRSLCGGGVVTAAVSTTCPITTTPAIAITQLCPANPAIPGGLLTYSGTVSNAGNITLIDVEVVNNLSGATPIFITTNLAPGAVANFTGSYVAPTNCSTTSISSVTARSLCGDRVVVSASVSTTCPINTTPAIAITQNCPNQTIPGGVLTYSGTVSNAGNITLTNVVVLNNVSGATPVFTAATMAPGAVSNFTGSYVAPANCSSTSTSTATGRSICGIAVTNTASTTCPITTTPAIAITQLCPTKPARPGELLTYSGTVSNAGNIALNDVEVVNNLSGATPVFITTNLAPGAVANFTGSYLTPTNCSTTSISSVTARSLCGDRVVVTAAVSTTCPINTTPAIAVTQRCPVNPVIPGGLLTYSGTVSNAGDITLTNVVVLNNVSGATPVFTAATMAPGAVSNFTGSYVAPANCSSASTSTATGQSICGIAVTNTASTTCAITTTPSIAVTKACPTIPVAVGGVMTVTGTVTNTGNITLTNVLVINNQPVPNTLLFGPITLAPGVGATFTGSYTAPTNVCSVTDVLIASGNSPCTGQTVLNTATATCPLLTAPAIEVTQACPLTPVVQGGLLTYSGTVKNVGNVTLTNIIVVNNWPVPNTVVFTVASLAPGVKTNFTGSYQVPGNCCVAWVTVVGSGKDCNGVTVTDTSSGTCTVLTSPQIVVTKVCTPPRRGLLRPGDLLLYSGTVSNAGNTTLINVTVVSDQPVAGSLLLGPLALAPGESIPYTASYIVPPDFCGGDTVTASGLDVCAYSPVTSSVTVTCPVAPYNPRIAVSKHCPELSTPHGGTLTYSGTVSNAGNVTLVNVFVVDNQPTNNAPVIGPITLAPGAFTNFTGSYIVPLVCCEVIDTLTARGQDRCSGSNVTATATAVCPLRYTPGIVVMQSCPPNGIPSMFGGFVTNTGDAMMTNVVVSSSLAGKLLGPLDLAPGQSEPYAGSNTNLQVQDMITVTGVSTCGFAVSNTVPTIRCFSNLRIAQSSATSSFIVIVPNTEIGKSYTVQYKNSMNDPAWTDLETVIGDGKDMPVTVSTAEPSRFYRVVTP